MTQIEQSTIYAYKLKHLENPNFDKIRLFAKNFVDELPPDLQNELYEKINRGIDQLETEPEMLVYLYSFGNMHQAKLNYAFEHLPDSFFEQSEINIIDYGCGQAIGTMCYVDFLKRKNPNQKIKSVTLIEPSEICLKRAGLHASVFLPETEIRLVNKTFDQLSDDVVVCDENIPTLHILSNVLDLDFDLPRFSSLINRNIKGYNQFVCVGPYFNYSDKDQRMQEFAESLNGDVSFAKMLEKGELSPLKSWTCQTVVFSLRKEEESLSTEVTEYEIENGVEDEYGVVYSKDGKRLLRAPFEFSGEYSVKKGTKVICDRAFFYNSYEVSESLQSITIPSSVTNIGYEAFGGCISLKSITIPSSVTSIGNGAFRDCKSLQTITIPSSVTSIGKGAFGGCISLKSVTIPESVTTIGKETFGGCISLESITIPSSVTSIGNGAFGGCISLTSFSIPKSVTTIGDSAFEECYYLESVTIPENVTSIGTWAFLGCTSLQSVTIPSSVTSIKYNTFRCCESLQSITIPSSVTSIGYEAFSGCKSLQFVTIPSSVTTIGARAFAMCYYLKSVTIPEGVASIGYEAFVECKSLQSVTIPEGVTTIGKGAFSGCTSLLSVTISKSVTSIGYEAFGRCISLQSIYIPMGSREKFEKMLPEYADKLKEV